MRRHEIRRRERKASWKSVIGNERRRWKIRGEETMKDEMRGWEGAAV